MELKNIVIMKYGVHAKENVHSIILRKKTEDKECGRFFWGYNGVLCHPGTQIQPFLKENQMQGEKTYLVLVRTFSDFNGTNSVANEYSIDKLQWNNIPPEIKVVGSKYALICRNLKECKLEMDLANYVIAVGQSKGKLLQEYLKGRVDKACARFEESTKKIKGNSLQVLYYAEIINAVYIR